MKPLYLVYLTMTCFLMACSQQDESVVEVESPAVNQATEAAPENTQAEPGRPNFLIIMADDLGYTDIAAFGSEISTPNIDTLATEGMSFTQFYAAPTCSPSRSMMLTGLDNHFTGFGTMAEHLAENQKGHPGYEGYLNDRIVTLPQILQDNGYHTYMAGKWHIGAGDGMRPQSRGFERSIAMMHGGAGHFSDKAPMLSIIPETLYFEDDEKVGPLPENFYSSEYYADRIIEYIDSNKDDDAPFFAWLAFTAVHWPLQVRDEHLDLYKGVYDEGYEVLREQRLANARRAGLVPDEIVDVPRLPRVTPWDELSDDEKKYSSRTMEIYAAMVERMDFHIGRVIDYLKSTGQYDNTIIIFMSDNGSEGHDRLTLLDNATFVPATYDLSYENLGRLDSYAFLGPGWGQATTAPLRLFKAYVTEGGLRVPFIIKGHEVEQAGSYNTALATIQDIMPTFMDYAGIDNFGDNYQGKDVFAITGRTIRPLINGTRDNVYNSDEALGWELFGHRAIRKGDWKILWADGKNGSDTWQLFNITEDPREVVDLSEQYPEKREELLAHWQEYSDRNNVILPVGDIGNPN